MTVGELKKKLEGVDDTLQMVVIGHFGEGIKVHSWDWRVKERVQVTDSCWTPYGRSPEETVFVVPFTDIGEDPT